MTEINRNLWDRAANTWRRLVDTATIAWDISTPGVASASVVAGSIGTAQLADGAVTNAKLAGPRAAVQTFTAGATYTPTADMKTCRIRVQAPGGGSGGADGAGPVGGGVASGGGGAGEYAEGWFTAAQIGASQAVTIGAVGTAGSDTGGNGGVGGTTSVGSLITGIGGSGGTGTGSDSTDAGSRAGGVGGTGGTGGTVRVPGQAGGSSDRVTDEATFGLVKPGAGGNAVLGHGPPAPAFSDGEDRAAVAGPNYGAGARGAQAFTNTGVVGAVGGAGIVIIEEFF